MIALRYSLFLMVGLLIVSCGSGGVTNPDESAAKTVSNVRADSSVGWVYYSLDGDSVVPSAQADTDHWDVRMAYLKCCGQTQQIDVLLNSGTSGPGSTRGAMVSSRFENLRVVPVGIQLRSDDTARSARIVPPNVIGSSVMFVYDIQTHTLRPSPDRCLVIQTSRGNMYKFQFMSIYQDAVSAPTLDTPLGFYHFRYQRATNGAW
ncbi:MAG: HmuY family protein [Candidatus Kapaibacteriota bacterium]